MSSRKTPRRAQVVDVDRVCAHYQTEDRLVRWRSSHSFYLKQMTWSVETVTQYWRDIMHSSRNYPHFVPMEIRFCMSWLSGIDCTNWSTEKCCVWLNHRFSRGHKFSSMMYLAWIHRVDPCPIVSTARPPWSRLNIPTVVGRVHLPPPKFVVRVETTVRATDVAGDPGFVGAASSGVEVDIINKENGCN